MADYPFATTIIPNTIDQACLTTAGVEQANGVDPPWIKMPPDGSPFDERAAIATPAAGGAETVILQFRVPEGHDGVILGIHCGFTGPGFNQGSGDLTWALKKGPPGIIGEPVRNYGRILFSLGTIQENRQVHGGILIRGNDYIVISVIHSALSPIIPGGTSCTAALAGYYWGKNTNWVPSVYQL